MDRRTGGNGYGEEFHCDLANGQLTAEVTQFENQTYQTKHTQYDALGRLVTTQYPTTLSQVPLEIQREYKNGYLFSIRDVKNPATPLWELVSTDAYKSPLVDTYGNGLQTTRTYDPIRGGRIETIKTVNVTKANEIIQDLAYRFDGFGNLQSRQDNTIPWVENFGYDKINRLTTINGAEKFKYDALGNLLSKEIYGQSYVYRYDERKPHRVVDILPWKNTASNGDINYDGLFDGADYDMALDLYTHTGAGNTEIKNGKYVYKGRVLEGNPDCNSDSSVNVRDLVCIAKAIHREGRKITDYAYLNLDYRDLKYDNNGNMTHGAGRSVDYYSFGKPRTVQAAGGVQTLTYDAELIRVKKTFASPAGATHTTYVGDYEKIDDKGVVKEKVYLKNAYGVFAVWTRTATADRLDYIHKDHLGSTDVLSNVTKNAQNADVYTYEKESFDAWGLRRNADGSVPKSKIAVSDTTTKGYTGHEQDDDIGLINMSARLYDPVIGRFISPDPTIPDLDNMQTFNRYSYVYNNPLSLTDPTGLAGEAAWPEGSYRLYSASTLRDFYLGDLGNVNYTVGGVAIISNPFDGGSTIVVVPDPSVREIAETNNIVSFEELDQFARSDMYHQRPAEGDLYEDSMLDMLASQSGIILSATETIPQGGSIDLAVGTNGLASVVGGASVGGAAVGWLWRVVQKLFRGGAAKGSGKVANGALKQFGRSIDDLSSAANQSINKEGLTAAARALTKHASGQRGAGTFPKLRGGIAEQNKAAQQIVDDILGNATSKFTNLSRRGLEVRAPDGRGIRFNSDGQLSGFLDPRK